MFTAVLLHLLSEARALDCEALQERFASACFVAPSEPLPVPHLPWGEDLSEGDIKDLCSALGLVSQARTAGSTIISCNEGLGEWKKYDWYRARAAGSWTVS